MKLNMILLIRLDFYYSTFVRALLFEKENLPIQQFFLGFNAYYK